MFPRLRRRLGAFFVFAFLPVALPAALPAQERDLDLVITGGRVLDPETGLDAIRDIGGGAERDRGDLPRGARKPSETGRRAARRRREGCGPPDSLTSTPTDSRPKRTATRRWTG